MQRLTSAIKSLREAEVGLRNAKNTLEWREADVLKARKEFEAAKAEALEALNGDDIDEMYKLMMKRNEDRP